MVKESIKKILTYRSGKFVFSSRFSEPKLSKSLIEAKVIYDTTVNLPLLVKDRASLNVELSRRSILATAAIGGNKLPAESAREIISRAGTADDAHGGCEQSAMEIRNIKEAYDYAGGIPFDPRFFLTEEAVQKIHYLVTKGLRYKDNTPGRYRSHEARVGDDEHGGVYTPPRNLDDIRMLMREFILWINGKELMDTPPEVRAALAHYHLCLIHPFGEGNGRCARVVEGILLGQAGKRYIALLLPDFYYRNMDEYFRAFSDSIRGGEDDVTPFLEFTLKGWIDSLSYFRGKIMSFLRKGVLRAHFGHLKAEEKINQRQYDLLILLMDYRDYRGSFTLEDLFSASPFCLLYRGVSERTGRRDLKKLSDMKLLNTPEGAGYILNPMVLE